MVISATYAYSFGENSLAEKEENQIFWNTVFVVIGSLVVQYFVIESAVLSAMKKHDKNKQKEASENTDNNG